VTRAERSTADSLAEQIRLLEAENQILNERSEDMLLLGLVAERISPLSSIEEVVGTLLEQVSILYDIPYCGFARIDRPTPEFRHEYMARVDRVAGSSLSLAPRAVDAISKGALVCAEGEAADKGVDLEVAEIDPSHIILIPCACQSVLRGVFIFAHDNLDTRLLGRKLIVLQQVAGLATSRMDNIHLLEELQQLNADLEARVHDRTVELHRAVRALGDEVAERRRAEEIIAGERHRLYTVVEHLPEGVVVLDGEDRIVLANRAVRHAAALIGSTSPGERLTAVAGRPLADFESSASEPRWVEVRSETDPILTFEAAVRRLDSPVRGSVVVLRDITDQRAVAEQLLRQERIAAMGHLAAGIAHDFNNLIQGITILAEGLLLDDDADPEPRKVKTREILAIGERGAGLIRQILDYSRQTVSQPQAIDLKGFLAETLNMLDRLIPETLELDFAAAPGLHTIRIDPGQLQQVLTNLTLNASQAMNDGGQIRVRLWNPDANSRFRLAIPEFEDRDWVCLSVTDTGCGIPPAVQPHVFEPFYTTKERGRGTGLGLAQAYGIVKQNDGHISFETEPGRGTTFTLLLPVEHISAEEPGAVAERPAPPMGSDEAVLVVEDDPTVRKLTGELLETLGYRPVCVENGLAALAFIDEHDDDLRLVLSDVSMPNMGGVELTVELLERLPEIPVVLMSGYAPDPMGGGFTSDNLAAWLPKPFSVDALASTIAEVLSSGGS
jgi:signal transduction histidine kinase